MILGILFIFGFLVYRISCSLKFKTFNVWREVAIWIFFIYLVVVANLTLFKHGVFEYPISIQQLIDRVNLVPLVETYKMLTDGWIVAYSWYQVIANILVLIPLGFLTPILFKSLTKWWHILIVGCSTSLLIEVFQILTPQNVVDVDDLIFNTLGAMIGYGVYLLFIKLVKYFKLMNVVEKFEVPLKKPIIRVASVPISIMVLISCLASILAYYESTLCASLSDEELVTAHLSYEGEIISTSLEDYRLILKDYGEYLDLDIYQELPLNRVRMIGGSQWHPKYNEMNYEFMFLTDDFRVDDEAIFVIFGKNEAATQIKITYLEEEYIEELSPGNFLVVYPKIILMDDDNLYQLYDSKESKNFEVEFLSENGEVVNSL